MLDAESGHWPQKSEIGLRESYTRYRSATWCNRFHTMMAHVDKHQNVERIVFSNMRYRGAQEHANRGSWRSDLGSERSGWKSCIQSLPYHDRHRLQVLARWYHKSSRTPNPKIADALLMERPTITGSHLAQNAIWNMRIGPLAIFWTHIPN